MLVPNLRHVLVTASAIATMEGIAPGRLACAFGTGATARLALGQPPLPWAFVRRYLEQLRTLLRGDVAEVDGGATQMVHLPRFAPERPIEVPLLLSALGPKGQEIAREVADGVMTVGSGLAGFDWSAQLVFGTVLADGEELTSERVKQAAGPWYTVLMYHFAYESAPDALDGLPAGREWRDALDAERSEGERHLAVHQGHVTDVTDRDRVVVDAAGDLLGSVGWVGDRAAITARVAEAEAAGSTELIYAPAGPQVADELTSFAEAATG